MQMKDVKEAEVTELHITHGMLPVREKQGLEMLPRCLSSMEDDVEVFLPADRIQATGPARERGQVHWRARCITCASGTPGGNPQQADGYTGLQTGEEVWSGEVRPVGSN